MVGCTIHPSTDTLSPTTTKTLSTPDSARFSKDLPLTPGQPILPLLIITAAPGESRAVAAAFDVAPPDADFAPIQLNPNLYLVQSGVGKVNAALAALHIGVHRLRAASVLSLGVAGALPRAGGPLLALGSLVLATSSVYADEGSQNPHAFVGIDRAGFPPGGKVNPAFPGLAVSASSAFTSLLLSALAAHPDLGAVHQGPIATVSTCSGTDALARAVADRTSALAEAMEGAAIAHALARLAPATHFAELRVISNPTGDRTRQTWDLPGAFARLTSITRAIAVALPDRR